MALGGAGLGLVLGAGLGAYQASEERRGAARMRRRARRQAQAALQSPDFQAGADFIRSFFGFRGSPGAQVSRNGVAFDPGTPLAPGTETPLDVLSQDFTKGLRSAQAARGLFESQAGAAAEASGLAAFRTNIQLGLLPHLFQLGEAPLRLNAMAAGGQLPLGPSVGSGALAGGVSGAFGGAGIEQQSGGDLLAQLMQLFSRSRQNAAPQGGSLGGGLGRQQSF